MIINKTLFCFLVGIFSFHLSYAQINLLNSKKVSDIGVKTVSQQKVDANDQPLSYGNTNDDDILWSKIVWEVIDLNQKINHPFYYPINNNIDSIKKTVKGERLSLYNALNNGIQENKIKTYRESSLIDELSLEKINTDLSSKCKNGDLSIVNPEEFDYFKIKGIWYFDKRQGELKYRLLAIAPLIGFDAKRKCGIAEDIADAEENQEEGDEPFVEPKPKSFRPLYWVFYPEAREVLHNAKVFNPENSVHPISFDHLLNARRFSSVIVQEENVYGNRAIEDYTRGNSIFQLLEAEKIKESIRNKEIDMWNY